MNKNTRKERKNERKKERKKERKEGSVACNKTLWFRDNCTVEVSSE